MEHHKVGLFKLSVNLFEMSIISWHNKDRNYAELVINTLTAIRNIG